MMKMNNHTHEPAKRHTRKNKPCSFEKNSKVRVFEHYKKSNAYTQNADLRSAIKSTPYHPIHRNPLTDVKSWGYDYPTTTHIAVKPSRHTSVIFMPNANGYYPVAPTGVNASHTSYDGFGEPNTRAFTVNKFRPLCGVVASRHPMIFPYGDNLLTKHIGGYHA